MVANHWSNDAMVTIHRSSLVKVILEGSQSLSHSSYSAKVLVALGFVFLVSPYGYIVAMLEYLTSILHRLIASFREMLIR